MLHCRSTSHLRRTRLPLLPLFQLRVRELDPWRKTSTPRPLPRVPCHRRLPCRNPPRTSGRDAVTPRPTKASDGQLPPMRISQDAKPPQGIAMFGIRIAKSGCQSSVTTRPRVKSLRSRPPPQCPANGTTTGDQRHPWLPPSLDMSCARPAGPGRRRHPRSTPGCSRPASNANGPACPGATSETEHSQGLRRRDGDPVLNR